MRKLISFVGLLLILSACLLVVRVYAQQDKWMPLGKARMSSVSTSAYVPSDAGMGTVCSLRFRVEDSKSLELHSVTVHFGNSQVMHYTVDFKLSGDTYSPSLPLQGTRRTVKGVDVVYDRLNGSAEPPTLDLWGNGLIGAVVCPR
jgi:hypothetical protein